MGFRDGVEFATTVIVGGLIIFLIGALITAGG